MARGSIRKRASGQGTRYDVVVDLGPDPATGRRRQRSKSFSTRREAQAHLTRWLSEIDAGTAIEQTTQTVRELLSGWLENDVRQRVHATIAIDRRDDSTTASEQAGHTDIDVTLDVYIHATEHPRGSGGTSLNDGLLGDDEDKKSAEDERWQ